MIIFCPDYITGGDEKIPGIVRQSDGMEDLSREIFAEISRKPLSQEAGLWYTEAA
jgi:hypothetical protein